MAISREEFNNALREAVAMEFSHVPMNESDIDYTFSEGFNKKMEKLIRSQKKSYWKWGNTASKRVAIILIALMALFTTACGIPEIREGIVEFVTEVYEEYIRYFFEGDTRETITKEYRITELPEGFEETEKFQHRLAIITTYENKDGDIIEFTQSATDGAQFAIDAEHGNIYTEMIADIEIIVFDEMEINSVIWIYDGYYFVIDYTENVDTELIKQLVLTVK